MYRLDQKGIIPLPSLHPEWLIPCFLLPLAPTAVPCPGRIQLARLLALSHGEKALTRERWSAMRALEERRRQRLAGGAAA
jgi:hypothetical protein